MPRRRRLRKVVAPPNFKGYKPYGNAGRSAPAIELFYEEYEAIKLADYDNLNHLEASEMMGVSRPTFARIYVSARKKMAQALVETREIRTIYGNARLDKNWFLCQECNARFTLPSQTGKEICPLCRSSNIENISK